MSVITCPIGMHQWAETSCVFEGHTESGWRTEYIRRCSRCGHTERAAFATKTRRGRRQARRFLDGQMLSQGSATAI